MELSKITIGLIFIFLPGIIALIISERLTDHPERKGYELFAYALILGCFAHVLYGLAYSIAKEVAPKIPLDPDRWIELMLDTHSSIQGGVVAITAAIGLLLGLLVAYMANHSWLHKLAQLLHVSQKFQETDVWAHLMNQGDAQWIVLRDHSKNLMYQGNVISFSTDEDPRELLLRDASVFKNDTGSKVYDVRLLYLSFEKTAVALEIF